MMCSSSPGAERSVVEVRIRHINQFSIAIHSVTMAFHIKITMQAYLDDHSFVLAFVEVRAVFTSYLILSIYFFLFSGKFARKKDISFWSVPMLRKEILQ